MRGGGGRGKIIPEGRRQRVLGERPALAAAELTRAIPLLLRNAHLLIHLGVTHMERLHTHAVMPRVMPRVFSTTTGIVDGAHSDGGERWVKGEAFRNPLPLPVSDPLSHGGFRSGNSTLGRPGVRVWRLRPRTEARDERDSRARAFMVLFWRVRAWVGWWVGAELSRFVRTRSTQTTLSGPCSTAPDDTHAAVSRSSV
jgi:hypothetical protein